MNRLIKILILTTSTLNFCVLSPCVFAQAENSSIKFTNTTQEILKKAREETLSDKNLSKRRIITKRISSKCDPNKNNIAPECKRENFIKNQRSADNISNSEKITGKSVREIKGVTNNNISGNISSGAGLSTGVATIGITSLILLTGAAVLTVLSIGGYGDNDSGAGSSGSSSSTTAAAN
ncbi:MAG: hypothetical protein CFH01_00809 [Alphaproteobacteria bacterium MarineAlpha2_Bin1]|nr:MAG: hypothetical protein CFH01_00809 [Alphaproteobacteria bacterium MarineAlpha2_Bin1]